MSSTRLARSIPYVCGVVVLAAGVAVLSGWPIELPMLGRLGQGPANRPASGLWLAALSLALIVARLAKGGILGAPARWLFAATTVGSLALTAGLLAELILAPARTLPASPASVLSMAAIALAIALAYGEQPARRQASVLVAMAGAVVPWLALLGYASGVPLFYELPSDAQVGVSLVSAIALPLLSLGVLGLWPEYGFVSLLVGSAAAGTRLRWLLPVAVVFPILFGAALRSGEQTGFIETGLGPAINLGLTGIGLLLWIGVIQERMEAMERAATAERERLLAELQAKLSELAALQNNLLTVCAWTRRVLDDGKWIQFEQFLDRRLHISVSHTISEEAAKDEWAYFEEQRARQRDG